MSDAADRGWGPGYPTNRQSDMVNLKLDGADFPAGVHKKIEGLMEVLLEESIARGWVRLHDDWCWGYANRGIKSPDGSTSNTPSNHSWGIAIDINAPENCFGCSSHKIPEAMGNFWTSYGFRWGGDYSGTKDWMHFEYMGTPTAAAQAEARARDEFMEDDRLDQYDKGMDGYIDKFKKMGGVDPGPPDNQKPSWFQKGWNRMRFAGQNPRGE